MSYTPLKSRAYAGLMSVKETSSYDDELRCPPSSGQGEERA